MPDNRDNQIVVNLIVPADVDIDFDLIRQALVPLWNQAIIVNEGQENEERGYIALIKHGHRSKLKCETVARWEIGRGKVK